MSGQIVYVPPTAHECGGRPPAAMLKAGTQWRCDECHRLWVVVEGSQYNEPYSAWRKLTEKNKDGRDLF